MAQPRTVASCICLFAFVGLVAGCSSGTAYPADDDGGLGSGGGRGGTGTGGKGGSGTGGTGGAVTVKRDGGSSTGGTGGGTGTIPTGDANCGIKNYGLDKQPAEVMIVLDKSGSMNMSLMSGGPSKWDEVVGALNDTVMATQSMVHWGLVLYPTNSSCNTSATASVVPAVDNASRISDVLNRTGPDGATPTRYAVQKATAFMSARTTTNPKYLLLATDGLPNCQNNSSNNPDTTEAIKSVGDANAAGIPVFVVGVATSGTDAHNTLNSMAEVSGRARTGDPKYFSVNTKAELVDYLTMIAGQVASCSFGLGTVPPDPNAVVVELDGMRVPRSGTNGWEYTAGGKSIVISGSWCDRLKAGELKNANILFGCPGEVPL
jgi:hypothetical protein